MDSPPLGYASLRAVLSHMEANKRIEYAIRMPSIRKLEKVLPLKIEKLSFGENFFIINQKKYRFGVYREYGTQETPNFIRTQNISGGCKYDVDKDGFEDEGTWYKALPGDIVMNDGRGVEEPQRDINLISVREQEVSAWEMELVELHLKLGQYRVAQENRVSLAHDLQIRLEAMNARWDINGKMEQIERARYEIQCYKSLRDGTPLPFKMFIQLRLCDAETRFDATPINPKLESFGCNRRDAKLPTAMRAVLKFSETGNSQCASMNCMSIKTTLFGCLVI